MIASVMRPWIAVDGGHQPDTAGQHENGPLTVFLLVRGPFGVVVAGRGFEPL